MKILYAIQGTGNGHVSRARSFIPKLKTVADIDVLVSGCSSEIDPGVPVIYTLPGLGYTFGKHGGIDFWDSLKRFKPVSLIRDIHRLPVAEYDLLISDFEPVSSWAAKKNKKICIGLSHQASFLSPKVPRPEKKNFLGEAIFKHYAPCTKAIGFHYREYDDYIYTPIIRDEIKELAMNKPMQSSYAREHITVYLPAYRDTTLIRIFTQITDFDWHVFSKNSSCSYSINNVRIKPVDTSTYQQSLIQSKGVICGAGFEAPSEALYLSKPLMVMPMTWQYEQYCNAAALSNFGVTVYKEPDQQLIHEIDQWLNRPVATGLSFPDQSENIIDRILEYYKLSLQEKKSFLFSGYVQSDISNV